MAERLIFHYHDRKTIAHSLDPRSKMFTLFVLTLSLLNLNPVGFLLILPYLALAMIAARMPVREYRKEILFFLIFSGMIFLMRWWGSGNPLTALTAAGRFLAIVVMGLTLSDTTSPNEMSLAIYWILRPFSEEFASNTAAKLNLTVSFFPVIFDASKDIQEARRSRHEDARRQPLRRLVSIGRQLFDLLLDRAEEISYALESRCFTPKIRHGSLDWRFRDTVYLMISCTYIIFVLYISINP